MSSTLRNRLDRALVALGVVLIVSAAVVLVTSSGSADTPPAAKSAAAVSVDHVQISDFKFAPATITVAVGTTITWTNNDNAPHTATSGSSPNSDGVFDSDTIKKGQSRTVKVSKAGTYKYYCAFHPFMQATVIVK